MFAISTPAQDCKVEIMVTATPEPPYSRSPETDKVKVTFVATAFGEIDLMASGNPPAT